MTGDVDQLMRAVALVVTKLSENPDYHLLTVGGSARGQALACSGWSRRVGSSGLLSLVESRIVQHSLA